MQICSGVTRGLSQAGQTLAERGHWPREGVH